MKSEILPKLAGELHKGIGSEVQIVYLMAGIRKLIDIDEARDNYTRLNFYCDWALHAKMSRREAKNTIRLFEDIYSAQLVNDRKLLDELWTQMHALTDGEELRAKLGIFLHSYDLPYDICDVTPKWRQFFSDYSAVITDIPLVFEATTGHVRKVSVAKKTERLPESRLIPASVRPAFTVTWETTTVNGETSPVMMIQFPPARQQPPQLTAPQTSPLPSR